MGAIILISVGVLFNIFGCIGLIRLPDMYNRLQAATKCVTRCCGILPGVLVHFGIGSAGFRALMAIQYSSSLLRWQHMPLQRAYHFGTKMDERSVKDDYREAVK